MTILRIGTLVTTTWLKEQLGSIQRSSNGLLRVLDTSWLPAFEDPDYNGYTASYKKSHIPGSKYFDLEHCTQPTKYIPYNIPDANCFTDYVQSLGISGDTHVIAYDSYNTRAAARAWFTFKYFGHNKVSILDGGLKKWLENGCHVTTEEPEYKRGNFEARVQPHLLRSYEAMLENIKSKQEQVIDSRPPAMFTGEKQYQLDKDVKPGHMPGSTSLPFSTLFNEDGTFKSEKDLQQLFTSAGVDLDKPVVASCLIGMTACGLSAAAHLLGKEILPLYNGSWVEFGQRADPSLILKGK